MGNLLHGHSWNYTEVNVVQGEGEVREPNEAVTAATDATGLIGIVAPKVTKELYLGPLSAGASIWNDPSTKNITINLLGLTDVFGPSLAVTGAANDVFDYGVNNSTPGPQKVYGSDQLQFSLPTQSSACDAAGLPSC